MFSSRDEENLSFVHFKHHFGRKVDRPTSQHFHCRYLRNVTILSNGDNGKI
jgi:hypothetical protein